MRTGGIIPLSVLALLWGFLQAPFDHVHLHEFEHEATAAPIHVHGHAAPTELGTVFSAHTADDDELDVLWNAATSAQIGFHADVEACARMELSRPSAISMAVLVPQHRGHDPPRFRSESPRAPPV